MEKGAKKLADALEKASSDVTVVYQLYNKATFRCQDEDDNIIPIVKGDDDLFHVKCDIIISPVTSSRRYIEASLPLYAVAAEVPRKAVLRQKQPLHQHRSGGLPGRGLQGSSRCEKPPQETPSQRRH